MNKMEQIYNSCIRIVGCSDALKYALEKSDIEPGLSDIISLATERIDSEIKKILDMCDEVGSTLEYQMLRKGESDGNCN